ncbi:hypothetical protein PINS_up021518 [Pythium insidiosum]|nr:hypothetical protein PINS_up021518 [Pythium insidiosum]
MGCAPSRVAAHPDSIDGPVQALAVVTGPSAASASSTSSSIAGRFLTKSQRRTAPAAEASSSSGGAAPTVDALPQSTKPTPTQPLLTGGPTVEVLPPVARTLHELSAEELATSLLKAVKAGDLALVQRLVTVASARAPPVALLDIRGMWESTPLIYACQYCHEPIALWLLDAGANAALVNEKGVSALLFACLEGMTPVVARVLQPLPHDSSSTAALGPAVRRRLQLGGRRERARDAALGRKHERAPRGRAAAAGRRRVRERRRPARSQAPAP